MPPFDTEHSNQDSQESNNIFNNQEANYQEPEVHPVLIGQNHPNNEVQDPLLRRADTAYQILATGILRANQTRQDLQARINAASAQITQCQYQLTQISEQLLEAPDVTIPQNEQEVTQALHTMQNIVRDAHYTNLITKLNELRQANYKSLPEIINAMRAELDTIEVRTQKIKVLEILQEAYKSQHCFQKYYERADQEFRNLLEQY